LETVILEVGGTLRFDKLRERGKELYITAVDIDKSKTVVFGDPGEHVSIPDAVEASIAIPGIYRSKEIDGRYCSDGGIKKNADLDTAIKKGADLIFVIHPLVPYTGGEPGFIHKLGPFGYLEQTYRTILTKNLNDSINLQKYLNPHVTVLRISPNSDDPRNFRNVLSVSPDKIKDNIQRGYEDTLRRIRINADFLSRAFHHHGYKETDFAQAIAQIGNSPFNGKTPINSYP
ncbi:MAG: patatin-like phospholipase family protein, partial [Planctomycetota bacterium]